MIELLQTIRLDVAESLRARWFLVYAVVFGALVALLFGFGLADSRVLGFTGLSRLLVTFIQLSMAILPVFVLISTVRSLAGDREAGVLEYMLSLPVSLRGWYWGRFVGRFAVVLLPVLLAMAGAVAYGAAMGASIPWFQFLLYVGLLLSLAVCFLGLGFLISSLARSVDIAQGVAFLVWLTLVLFLDLILLGLLIKHQASLELIVGIAVLNPLQAFRAAAIMLFDPELVMLGPSAFIILDRFGHSGYLAWALLYPLVLGIVFGMLGYLVFRNRDLP
ncbi:MAG TPA: ABC transporter permease subunit [Hyphomicrobiaceae bacterium]|nr:ABC transporter permease subunit [Hyphomicrobiaceae bacterium]